MAFDLGYLWTCICDASNIQFQLSNMLVIFHMIYCVLKELLGSVLLQNLDDSFSSRTGEERSIESGQQNLESKDGGFHVACEDIIKYSTPQALQREAAAYSQGHGSCNETSCKTSYLEHLSSRNPSVSKGFLENLEKKNTQSKFEAAPSNSSETKRTITGQSSGRNGSSNNCDHDVTEESSSTESEQIFSNNEAHGKSSCDNSGEIDSTTNYYPIMHENYTLQNDTESVIEPGEHVTLQQKGCLGSHDFISHRDWLDELESLYFSGWFDDLKGLLCRAFNETKDPFDLVLFILRFADFDFCTTKKSLAHVTLVEFESWIQLESKGKSNNELETLGLIPSNEHKDSALELIVTAKLLLFEPVRNIYQLDCKDNGFLEQHIRYLVHSGRRYKEAATITFKLNLQTCFEPTEILLPLLILDKLQLAESYVAGCPWQQRAFFSMLDRLCGTSDDELQTIVDNTNIYPKPKDHKLKKKILVKVAERLVKKFHLNGEDFPNIYKEKNLNGLRYLLHKKYSEKRAPTRKWDDLIETAIGNNVWLQERLIEGLLEFGDIEEAVRWTNYYNISLDCVPTAVQEAVERTWHEATTGHSEDWEDMSQEQPIHDTEVLYDTYQPAINVHQLTLPADKIFFVEDEWSLQECTALLSQPGTVVGFDAEWRPTMCRAESNEKLAIIQLATCSAVFILDMIALTKNVSDDQMCGFARGLFSNPDVLKLGYGVESDFQVMMSSCPPFKEPLTKVQRFVDVCPLSKEILNLPQIKKKLQRRKEFMKYEMERGLSELVLQCLGLPLDKTYQISDWERRPLMQEQLTYAALDAYCLLEVYSVLCRWVKESGAFINMEPKLYIPRLWPEDKKKRQSSRRKYPKPGSMGRPLSTPVHGGEPVPARSLSVVVDTMLQGLGRHLRCCGVDVLIMDTGSSHDQAAKIAREEGRILLTSGTPYSTLRSQVPEGMCMCVPAGNTRQQVAAVFHHYNVKATTEDIFSRCQICNGNQYTKVEPEHIRIAYLLHKGSTDLPRAFQPSRECAIDFNTLCISNGVPLKLGVLPEGIWAKVDSFYCCTNCGKIFWEGTHFKRVVSQFAHVLDTTDLNEHTKTVYNS